MPRALVDSPLGPLSVSETDGWVTSLGWGGVPEGVQSDVLRAARAQLVAYFDHRLEAFDLPLRINGSGFQRAVCDEMAKIPFGETRTYGDLAKTLGVPAQAVGAACGGNPIAIIIPCHRVLGADSLGGFSAPGGVEAKVALLRHEGAAGLLL